MGSKEGGLSRRGFHRLLVAGAAVAFTSPIGFVAIERTDALSHETDSPRNITFQPGRHPTTAGQVDAIWEKFYKGYLPPSIWNRDVAARMGKVAILAADGAVPFDSLTTNDMVFAWQLLPDRPAKIAQNGQSVLLMRGDGDYTNILDALPTADIQRIKEAVLENLTKRDTPSGTTSLETYEAYAKEAAVVAPAVIAAAALLRLALEKPKAEAKKTTPRISRRSLMVAGLKLGAGVATIIGLAEEFNMASFFASLSPTDGLRKFFEAIAEVNPLDLHGKDTLYLNARTALLCAKLEDAMDDLVMPKDARAAIVMGDGHFAGANDVLKSRQVRAKLIQEYAKLMIGLVKQMVGTNVSDKVIRISVTEQLAKYDVLEITDPGTQGDFDSAFPAAIKRFVKPYPDKRWASKQVLNALQGLY